MADLIVESISKSYPTRSAPLEVLRGVSLTLSRGESLAILGPSGSGKSTLLHILGALDLPTNGHWSLGGEDPRNMAPAARAVFRNRRIGFVFQDHHLLPQLSARENVLIPALALGRLSPEAVERADTLLEKMGLADRRDHRPAELSGGQRQRVALARALVMQPDLILADEPTGNLDQTTAALVGQLLYQMTRTDARQAMLIVVTHNAALAERFDHQMRLDDGRLLSERCAADHEP